MKLFMVALKADNEKHRQALTQFLIGQGWNYWFCIDDFCLVETPSAETTFSLALKLEDIQSVSSRLMVFEMNSPVNYWGKPDHIASPWFIKNWTTK